MFGIDGTILALIMLAGFSAGGLAYGFLFNRIASQQQVDRRLETVKKAEADVALVKAQRDRASDHQQRAHLLEHARILDLGQRRTGLVGGQRFLQGFLGQREGHGDGSVR